MLQRLKKKATKNYYIVKVIIKSMIITFFFSFFFIFMYFLLIDDTVSLYTVFINNLSMNDREHDNSDVTYDFNKHELNKYPALNSKYGKLTIESVNIKLPIYLGDSYKVLAKGLGHYAGSNFPGEGGSIIMAGHNTKGYLYNLYDVNIGDIIDVKTVYGHFVYEVFKTDIIKDKETNKLPLVLSEETLMVYTCYPHTLGKTNKRFVVYAHLVEASYE